MRDVMWKIGFKFGAACRRRRKSARIERERERERKKEKKRGLRARWGWQGMARVPEVEEGGKSPCRCWRRIRKVENKEIKSPQGSDKGDGTERRETENETDPEDWSKS